MGTKKMFIDGEEYEVTKKPRRKKYRDPLEYDGRSRKPPEKKQRRQDWLSEAMNDEDYMKE